MTSTDSQHTPETGHAATDRFDYGQILDKLPCYVVILDSTFTVVWSNELTRKDFGPSLNVPCRELYRLRKSQCQDCHVQLSFQDGLHHSTEKTLSDVHGNRIHVLSFSEPLRDENGELTHIVETSVDIT